MTFINFLKQYYQLLKPKTSVEEVNNIIDNIKEVGIDFLNIDLTTGWIIKEHSFSQQLSGIAYEMTRDRDYFEDSLFDFSTYTIFRNGMTSLVLFAFGSNSRSDLSNYSINPVDKDIVKDFTKKFITALGPDNLKRTDVTDIELELELRDGKLQSRTLRRWEKINGYDISISYDYTSWALSITRFNSKN